VTTDSTLDSQDNRPQNSAQDLAASEAAKPVGMLRSEDWMAVWVGGALLVVSLLVVIGSYSEAAGFSNPLKSWVAKPGAWESNPLTAFTSSGKPIWGGLVGTFAISISVFSLGTYIMGRPVGQFARGFLFIFLLAILAYILAGQQVVKQYNLEYALWALLVGLLISNTVGTPSVLKAAACTEFYIKTGLVLLGAEVLISRLLALGVPGIFVAWVVTPIVLISTFWFGQRVLKIRSPSLNMVISADMSVCGVSAAIATSAACKAKKEELSLAIGMSLTFTVIMMVIMPAVIRATGMSNVLGGAWMGGTIDATGAVAAAGAMLGDDALQVAATIKMIQNILIGFVAFGVAIYWVTRVEKGSTATTAGGGEIWKRFPKFILGFVGASLLFSLLMILHPSGEMMVDNVIGTSKKLRGWFFCLAFVSIGLETNFSALASQLKGGRPLILYLVGQATNLTLTLFMAWLMFEKVFPGAADVLQNN
jgi:uncharacterized integral membrane protein (TIGR00698 family)